MNHSGTKTIYTERLVLRPFEINDAEIMFRNWANDGEVTKYLTWTPHKTVDETISLLKSWTQRYKDSEYMAWALCLKQENEPIGSIDLTDLGIIKKEREIGYCIGRSFWHQGIMTEALRAVADYGFNHEGLKRITGRHIEENMASGAVMEKVGFQFIGKSRDILEKNNMDITLWHYELTKENFKRGAQ